jgi:biuret amidohydrolase
MERAFGLDIPLTLGEVCHPHRTALVVYDVQVGIVSQIADSPHVVECVRGVLEAAREGGYRVFFTRHMSLPNEVAGVIQLRTAMAWQRVDRVDLVKPAFLRDTPGFQITPEIAPLPTEGVIE